MKDDSARTEVPRAESLFDAMHRTYDQLRDRRDALKCYGIVSDHLPEDSVLMAFGLLGEHDRALLITELNGNWPMLRAKGLAHGEIANATTPELRLLSFVLPLADAIEDVWQRLLGATESPEPHFGMLRCATRVQGLWGQPARLHFAAQDVTYVLISADAVFGLQPALLAAETSGRCTGSFVFPVDDGVITITLEKRSGEVFRHTVRSMIERIE